MHQKHAKWFEQIRYQIENSHYIDAKTHLGCMSNTLLLMKKRNVIIITRVETLKSASSWIETSENNDGIIS